MFQESMTWAVAGIASWLKQLKHLRLWGCELASAAVMPMIGTLTCLTRLCMIANDTSIDKFPDAAIVWLTMLTGLKDVSVESYFIETARDNFWSVVNAARAG